MWDRPPRRCIFGPSIGPPVMSVSTPLCALHFFSPLSFCFLFATVVIPSSARRSRKISVPHGAVECRSRATSMRQLGRSRRPVIIRTYVSSPSSELSRAKSVHLRPINYEYRPEDCSLSSRVSFRRGSVANVGRNSLLEATPREAILSRDDVHDR